MQNTSTPFCLRLQPVCYTWKGHLILHITLPLHKNSVHRDTELQAEVTPMKRLRVDISSIRQKTIVIDHNNTMVLQLLLLWSFESRYFNRAGSHSIESSVESYERVGLWIRFLSALSVIQVMFTAIVMRFWPRA